MCLRGSVCLYQGEELGLPEAEVAFEDLQDPYGIAFWPEFKGRDGARTPMVWEASNAGAGFSTGRPLAARAARARPARGLRAGGAGLDARSLPPRVGAAPRASRAADGAQSPVMADGDVVRFLRTGGGEQVFVAANLGEAWPGCRFQTATGPFWARGSRSRRTEGRRRPR
jgi:alpha-glucosidase